MAHRFARRRGEDRGSLTLELAVVAPGLLVLVTLLVLGGRVAVASTAVLSSARDASRTASLARTPSQARAEATDAAAAALSAQGLQCASTRVDVQTSGFAVPVGQPAQVAVAVTCSVRLSDLALPGLPGSRTLTATVTSPLDTYRER